MKTKNKMIALVEIAIVLCSVFLVATLPAIAADQNQELQKASAEITTASEDKTLEIYGNANKDDTIDMGDVVYIKLAIFGKKPKTELCDAKYDGRINVLDVIQTKLIILGKEKELTFVDDGCAIVTVTKPLERIVLHYTAPDAFRLFGAADRVVGISSYMVRYQRYLPVISKKPCIGSSSAPDIEMILELEPDIIFTGLTASADVLAEKLKGTNIIVARLYPRNEEWRFSYKEKKIIWPGARDEVLKLGYILGEVEKAEEYAEWYDNIVDTIEERVSEIPEDEWPKVFWDSGSGGASTRKAGGHITGWKKAGGTLIGPTYGDVETEWLIVQNPDVIVGRCLKGGYGTDDESGFKAAYDDIMGVPGFNHVKAVQDGRVHIIWQSATLTLQLGIPICIAYQAKWYHPELFEDLDPQAIHQEFIDRFCPGLDFDMRTEGVLVYPPVE